MYSAAFKNGGNIPKKYTLFGINVNPDLYWDNPPNGTKSFALIVNDPDAPKGLFTHWLVKIIPVNTRKISENSIPGVEVANSWGSTRWRGPSPPPGDT